MVEIPLRNHFELVRLFSRLAQAARLDRWDEPVTVLPHMVSVIGAIVGPLLLNTPIRPTEIPAIQEDSLQNKFFDAVVVVDASASGFGALVQLQPSGEVLECRRGWANRVPYSAWAEPMAATEIVTWLRLTHPGVKKIAVVSDHGALPLGQRRPLSGNGAFSHAYHLNEFFRILYAEGSDHQVLSVPGALNIADGPSRDTNVGDTTWRVRTLTGYLFPSLHTFHHPYAPTRQRAWWNV